MTTLIRDRNDGGTSVSRDRQDEHQPLLAAGHASQSELWEQAVLSSKSSGHPTTTNLYLQSLNEMIDSNTHRVAALGRHVPELVLFLLYSTFILTGGLLDYASGLSNLRASNGTYVLVVLIVVLVFIIIDLDRPRRGFIEVDHSSRFALRDAFERSTPNRVAGD